MLDISIDHTFYMKECRLIFLPLSLFLMTKAIEKITTLHCPLDPCGLKYMLLIERVVQLQLGRYITPCNMPAFVRAFFLET